MRASLSSLALLAVVISCSACGSQVEQKPTGPAPAASAFHGYVMRPPVEAPAFRLRDQAGKLVTSTALRGHWSVVTFLYTHCPDECPLIADHLAVAQRHVPGLRAIAISVDPAGDTPAAVRTFIADHRLSARFRYLTGSRAVLRPIWAAYHVAVSAGVEKIVGHSGVIALIDPQGRERVLYDSATTGAAIELDLARLTR